MQRLVDDESGRSAPALQPQLHQQEDHLTQERVPSTSTISAMAVSALPAGRRASSPSPRPKSPTNRLFLLSSSQQSDLATASNHSKPVSRLSDAFASLGGRARTISTGSDPKASRPGKSVEAHIAETTPAESSFGIDADPFASQPGGSSTQISQLTSDASSTTTQPNFSNQAQRRQRGSLLYAATDALGLGRVGATISKRMGKRSSIEQSRTAPPPQNQPQSQLRRGLPWKGKVKPRGHWALQPPSSTHIISDVIEISAANTGRNTVRDEEEENERRERDRLREAAAESIGISPLFREDASSRLTESDGMNFDDSAENLSREQETSLDTDPTDRTQNIDNLQTNANGSAKPNERQSGLQLRQSRESRHNRSSSLSGIVTPTTPSSSSNWPLSPHVPPVISGNGRTPKGSVTASLVQPEFPPFPCLFSTLSPFTCKSSSLLKFFPSAPLLIRGFSRQWRSRTIVMTSPPHSKPPSLSGFRSMAPDEVSSSIYYLHLFKSSGADEKELERLEVNESSVVFVAEEEVAGKRSVVKVGGMDAGGKKKEVNVEEACQTMWLLSIADMDEAQTWITTLKNAVLDQRAEKAGIAKATQPSAPGPKGDLDVMLTLRAQEVASTVRQHAQRSSKTLHEEIRARNSESPAPTVKSWSGETRPSSPSGRMMSLKSLFSVPGRSRSLSHGTNRSEDSPTTPVDPPSFTSRGTTLLDMIRPMSGNSTTGIAEADSKSAPSSPITTSQNLPVPIAYPGPILSAAEMNLDRVSLKERDREMPEWYTLQSRQRDRGDSLTSFNTGSALLPPPRNKRPWTSAGFLTNTTKREQQTIDNSPPSRRSFQSTVSLRGARLSLDGKTNPPSVDSNATATGAVGLGAPELGSKRASLSSSVSSFVSAPPDRDPLAGRSSSTIQRRIRAGKIPKMLTPPAGPPPSVPTDQIQPTRPSFSSGEPNAEIPGDQAPSRSSSLRSATNSDTVQNGMIPTGRRLSTSSALSSGSVDASQARGGSFSSVRRSSNSLSPKRTSVPPPQRPAPTCAPPPTPLEVVNNSKENGVTPRRASFRESLSPRSLRFSLSPQSSKDGSHPDDALRRRSLSNGSSVPNGASSHTILAPPAPPPTGPLPPTPRDPVPNRYSIRERLRMRSAPSPPLGLRRGAGGPPTTLPGSPPLVTVSSVASLKESTHSIPIGEPITEIPKDLNFLNMSSPVDSSSASTEDADFLNVSTPHTASFPKQIPGRSSELARPEHPNGSPPTPEMTALPPPPRRGRNGTISEKDRDRSSPSVINSVEPTTVDGILPNNIPLETVTTI
ncbi:uncharacterized protein FOMMEDRAFT_171307 [Fomitiporia mediterranea MF3/22]|uniref:uncharacterized protein n=1 Tax=Fomitiporia mediterranea (strain MF3/22) TaxID=694068 RepID=UPI0004408E64|nr:uncharacterized protein FOMMEDRAFT_171307 [Fomitiporia mediterranea MF3/22]EJC97901.1 hypothetical protein FOMMEDRAFT_171307 [Fomitiporia mediterranea MF3/22]